MSTNPEDANAKSAAKPAAPAPKTFDADAVTYVGPAVDNNSPVGNAVKGEVWRGILGILGGIVIMLLGVWMIHDGVHGEVAFTLHFGEHNSFDVKTAVVGIIVLLAGLALAIGTAIKVDWKTTPANQAPAPGTGAGGA